MLSIPMLSMIPIFFCTVNLKAQNTEGQKEREQKFYKAKHKLDQGGGGFGYAGGVLAPLGASLYFLYPDKVGFYASFRASTKDIEDYPKTTDKSSIPEYKNLVLNVGITKNFGYPIGAYLAAGVSEYTTFIEKENYSKLQQDGKIGADVSGGIIITVLREFNVMGGVSLFNLSKPEICFGIGWNFGR